MENRVSVDDFPQPGNADSSKDRRASTPYGLENTLQLPSVGNGISLWWTPLERPRDVVLELAELLSSEERMRAQRFGTESLRSRWIVGRSTLRTLLGQALGIPPSAVTLARGRRGRPQLAAPTGDLAAGVALDFNVSHTRGMALIGIATNLPAALRIGVDVEHGERLVNADGLSRKFLSPREQATLGPMTQDQRRREFLRLWTCKEAMSKATGDALSAPFRHLDIATSADGAALIAGPSPYLPANWTLHDAAAPDGFIATVAEWQSDSATSP